MDDRFEILHSVRRYVWSGLYDPEEVTIILAESWGLQGHSDEDWLRAEVEKVYAEKRKVEETWPATTDCDRLDRVFAALEAEGIIVEQDAGLTKSDGLEIVTEAYEDAQTDGEAAGIVGYCYYHGQDLDRAMESGDLWLAFGDFTDDERGADIGRRVRFVAMHFSLAVDWMPATVCSRKCYWRMNCGNAGTGWVMPRTRRCGISSMGARQNHWNSTAWP